MRRRTRISIVPLTVISLMNLPVAFSPGSEYLAGPLIWLVSALGAVGLIGAAAVLARRPWAHPFVLGAGLANVIAGVAVLAFGHGEGVVGTVFGLAVVAFAAIHPSDDREEASVPSNMIGSAR